MSKIAGYLEPFHLRILIPGLILLWRGLTYPLNAIWTDWLTLLLLFLLFMNFPLDEKYRIRIGMALMASFMLIHLYGQLPILGKLFDTTK